MINDTGSILAVAIGAFRKPGIDQAQPFLHLQFHGNFWPKLAIWVRCVTTLKMVARNKV
jgi:hypothetical protein